MAKIPSSSTNTIYINQTVIRDKQLVINMSFINFVNTLCSVIENDANRVYQSWNVAENSEDDVD
jgi:hypothetical protein